MGVGFSQTEIERWLAITNGAESSRSATHVMIDVATMLREIGGRLSHEHANRLQYHYPSYEWAWRVGFLRTLEYGIPHTVAAKLQAKGQQATLLDAQQITGHEKWIYGKYFKAAVRVLFLRYLYDDKLAQDLAIKRLFERFDATYHLSARVKNPKDAPRTIRNYCLKHWRNNPRGYVPAIPRKTA